MWQWQCCSFTARAGVKNSCNIDTESINVFSVLIYLVVLVLLNCWKRINRNWKQENTDLWHFLEEEPKQLLTRWLQWQSFLVGSALINIEAEDFLLCSYCHVVVLCTYDIYCKSGWPRETSSVVLLEVFPWKAFPHPVWGSTGRITDYLWFCYLDFACLLSDFSVLQSYWNICLPSSAIDSYMQSLWLHQLKADVPGTRNCLLLGRYKG